MSELAERLMEATVALHEASPSITLRDYQEEGVRWMMTQEAQSGGGLLGDDPGLGKTYQTLALCADWREGDHPTLVVVPTSIIQQWATAARAIYGHYGVYLHHGKRRHAHLWEMPRCRIVITSYGLLLHDDALQQNQWGRAVLDEIHYIKNHTGKTAKRAYSLQAPFRWGLSGTPVQNRPKETEALFRFVLGMGPDPGPVHLDLVELMETRFLRRTKETHLELPEITVSVQEVDFESRAEADFYQKVQTDVARQFQEMVGGEAREENMAMFELLLRLRQASCHPQLVLNGLQRKYDVEVGQWEDGRVHSSKQQHLVSMIRGHPAEAALIFCQFTEEMDMLERMLGSTGGQVLRLDGSMSQTERDSMIRAARWADPPEVTVSPDGRVTVAPVFLIQIRAGGVGLNLQDFSQVYITSPDWNPCNEIQAIARAHRMGQRRPVTVHKLVLSGRCVESGDEEVAVVPIDQRILDIQTQKRCLMSDLLQEPELLENGIRKRRRLTKRDWQRLLK
jgi:SNF2 family DNA or RNA helicase